MRSVYAYLPYQGNTRTLEVVALGGLTQAIVRLARSGHSQTPSASVTGVALMSAGLPRAEDTQWGVAQ